jgi:hypothetical protein
MTYVGPCPEGMKTGMEVNMSMDGEPFSISNFGGHGRVVVGEGKTKRVFVLTPPEEDQSAPGPAANAATNDAEAPAAALPR